MRQMVLIDLDRTLIDEDYQLREAGLVDAIRQKRAEGWEIGLNSDTPLPTLNWWWHQLDMNGPIVCEKGAEVVYPEDDGLVVLTKAAVLIDAAKADIVETLMQRSGTIFLHGDATGFVRSVRSLPGVLANSLVCYNGLRKYSIGFFVRGVAKDGTLVLDEKLAQAVVDAVRHHVPRSDLLTPGELDPAYCFYYINPADVSKGAASLRVFEDCHVDRRVIIGDSMSDFVESDSVELCAVGNGSPSFLRLCSRVAKGHYASGVREILLGL